jgi:hypothetical protein
MTDFRLYRIIPYLGTATDRIMIRFFRKIRQQLLANRRLRGYTLYAVGEILLVMVGILLALQVNTWNQQRKDEIDFKFALKQLHQELTIDILMTEGMIDAGRRKNQLIDELYLRPDSISNHKLIRSILALDFNIAYFQEEMVNTEFRKSLIQFNPQNEFQNELSALLLKYMRYDLNQSNYILLEEETGFHQLLEDLQVVDFPMQVGESFDSYINGQTPVDSSWIEYIVLRKNYESSSADNDVSKIRKLVTSEKFRLMLLDRKSDVLSMILGLEFMVIQAGELLEKIDEYLPGLEVRHEHLEITGSADLFEGWKSGLDMQPVDDIGLIWEIDVELPYSFIKFRTDKTWAFNWGNGYTGNNRLVFNGPNIEVEAGRYHIVVDLGKSTYSITPISN